MQRGHSLQVCQTIPSTAQLTKIISLVICEWLDVLTNLTFITIQALTAVSHFYKQKFLLSTLL